MRKLFSLTGNLVALVAGLGLLARYVPPQVFWPPAIVALLLPALLLFTLLFVLLQIYRRGWRSIVLPVIVLALALPTLGRLFAWPEAEPISERIARLTVVTNNARIYRDDAAKMVDTATVARAVRRYAADVLLVQEVRPEQWDENLIATISEAGGYGRRHQPRGKLMATYAADLEPVFSAFTDPNEYNGYLISDVPTELGTVRVINAHLESNQISGMAGSMGREGSIGGSVETAKRMLSGYGNTARVRARQAEEIRRAVEESPHPVILGGDFNDVPSSYTYHRILTPRLRDAWATRGSGMGTTFTGPLPGLRIDYIMVDTSLQVLTVERMPAQWSDHRPLRVVLTN